MPVLTGRNFAVFVLLLTETTSPRDPESSSSSIRNSTLVRDKSDEVAGLDFPVLRFFTCRIQTTSSFSKKTSSGLLSLSWCFLRVQCLIRGIRSLSQIDMTIKKFFYTFKNTSNQNNERFENEILANVNKKNIRAIEFYLRQGCQIFFIVMQWKHSVCIIIWNSLID